MKVDDALSGVTRVGIDSPALIYFIEAHPRYGPIVASVLRLIGTGRLTGITSAVTPAEVLVHPLQAGDQMLLRAYRALLFSVEALHTVPITPELGERAAELRARHRLRTPDALQLAVALAYGAQAFLTNDRGLTRITELHILVLDELDP